MRDYIGEPYIGVIKGDTRSLDYSSGGVCIKERAQYGVRSPKTAPTCQKSYSPL